MAFCVLQQKAKNSRENFFVVLRFSGDVPHFSARTGYSGALKKRPFHKKIRRINATDTINFLQVKAAIIADATKKQTSMAIAIQPMPIKILSPPFFTSRIVNPEKTPHKAESNPPNKPPSTGKIA